MRVQHSSTFVLFNGASEVSLAASARKEMVGLTHFPNEGLEVRVPTEGNDENLDGSDERRQRQDTTVDVLLSCPVRVLEERVEDSSDTERGLNDVGSVFADWEGSVSRRPRGQLERCILLSLKVVDTTARTRAGTSNWAPSAVEMIALLRTETG
jgi:hypothetical protein